MIMKKSRFLIARLLMLVAASGYAQDSYREAVKQYLLCNSDQLDKEKNVMASFNDLFVKDDAVDIDQLTQRFINERYEDALIDFALPMMKAKGMTEADLLEVTSLLSSPEGKAYNTHQQTWMQTFSVACMMSAMFMAEEIDSEDPEFDHIEVDPDIDEAYAAKFSEISEKMGFLDLLMKELDEGLDEVDADEQYYNGMLDWLSENAYNMALNLAYNMLTPEDLDYAEKLYSYESYRKLNDNSEVDLDDLKLGVIFNDYLNWMKEHGATLDENSDQLTMLKTMFGIED